jgi:predicted lipid-binding transport protein (Tim44 family)
MEFLDFGTLVFIVAAVVIFLRLRSVLGTRTGHEKPPYNPYAGRDAASEAKEGDNVVAMPRRRGEAATDANGGKADAKAEASAAHADLDALAPAGTPFNQALRTIRERDASFVPAKFLDGAKMAYEMIVLAFADGDRKTLRNLLAKDVFEGFSGALDEREKMGQKVQSSFVGIKDAAIIGAEVKGSEANVTLRIASEIITATIGKDGAVIEGDPETVTQVTDVWTFARDLRSKDPNWKLVATEDDE